MTAKVFTQAIRNKGYTVKKFCEYWRISERTYRRWCANEQMSDKLTKMIEGLR